jgi:hypothetical protein
MRILINQVNRLETTPILAVGTTTPLTSLTITAKLYNGATLLDTTSLAHTSGGIYVGTIPVIAGLVDLKEYDLEVVVQQASVPIWYFKGPVTAVIRKTQ